MTAPTPTGAPARPSPGGPFDAVSAAIGAGAALALFRLRAGVIQVVLGCGLLGLVLTFVRAG